MTRPSAWTASVYLVTSLTCSMPAGASPSHLDGSEAPSAETLDQDASHSGSTSPRLRHFPPFSWSSDEPLVDPVSVVVLVDEGGTIVDIRADYPDSIMQALRRHLASATFFPASSEGKAVSAWVRVRVPLSSPEVPSHESPKTRQESQEATVETPEYGAVAVVAVEKAHSFRIAEARDAPGTMGDPFRVLASLPSTLPTSMLLPYPSVRGAPPSGTRALFDGLSLPGLYHLGLGPAVVHPGILGAIDVYRGYAPADFGGYTGGVLAAELQPLAVDSVRSEAELRLLDVNAMAQAPIGDFDMRISGRYGYPGLATSLFSSVELSYWDYQIQVANRLDATTRLELLALGSVDALGSEEQKYLDQAFHIARIRLHQESGSWLYQAEFVGSFERGELLDLARVEVFSFGPALRLHYAVGEAVKIRAGFSMTARQLEVSTDSPVPLPGSLLSVRDRGVYGAFVAAELKVPGDLRIHPGLRVDAWKVGDSFSWGLGPRLQIAWGAFSWLSLTSSFAVTHQPITFALPLPALSTAASESGLQRSIHGELGAEMTFPGGKRLLLAAFVSEHHDIVFADPLFGDFRACPAFECQGQFPRSDSRVWGLESMLRMLPLGRLSGWAGYTLSWARAVSELGQRYTPTTDVRHVANLVTSYRIGSGWQFGVRTQLRSGRLLEQQVSVSVDGASGQARVQVSERLPWQVQLDLQLVRTWSMGWGSLRFTAEVINVLAASDPGELRCDDALADDEDRPIACRLSSAPVVVAPNLSLRATF